MKHTTRRSSLDLSRQMLVRLCLKITAFLLLCSVQIASGQPNFFSELTGLAALLCIALALAKRESPWSRSLNHWDEAWCFGLASCVEHVALPLG